MKIGIERQVGTDVEKGMAVKLGTRTGFWVYIVTMPVTGSG
jgi:hypothetical protein